MSYQVKSRKFGSFNKPTEEKKEETVTETQEQEQPKVEERTIPERNEIDEYPIKTQKPRRMGFGEPAETKGGTKKDSTKDKPAQTKKNPPARKGGGKVRLPSGANVNQPKQDGLLVAHVRDLIKAMAQYPTFSSLISGDKGERDKANATVDELLSSAINNMQALMDNGIRDYQARRAAFSLTAEAWIASQDGSKISLNLRDELAEYAKNLDDKASIGTPKLKEMKNPKQSALDFSHLNRAAKAVFGRESDQSSELVDLRQYYMDKTRGDLPDPIMHALRYAERECYPEHMTSDIYNKSSGMPIALQHPFAPTESFRLILHTATAIQISKALSLHDKLSAQSDKKFVESVLGPRDEHMAKALYQIRQSAAPIGSLTHPSLSVNAIAQGVGSLIEQSMQQWIRYKTKVIFAAWPHRNNIDAKTDELMNEAEPWARESMEAINMIRRVIGDIEKDAAGSAPNLISERIRTRGEIIDAMVRSGRWSDAANDLDKTHKELISIEKMIFDVSKTISEKENSSKPGLVMRSYARLLSEITAGSYASKSSTIDPVAGMISGLRIAGRLTQSSMDSGIKVIEQYAEEHKLSESKGNQPE